MNFLLSNYIIWLIHCGLGIWFFSTLSNRENRKDIWLTFLALAPLPTYLQGFESNVYIKTTIRAILFFPYIKFRYKQKSLKALYLAFLYFDLVLSMQMFLSKLLEVIIGEEYILLPRIIFWLLLSLFISSARFIIPTRRIQSPGMINITLIFLVSILLESAKEIIIKVYGEENASMDFIICMVSLTLISMVIILFLDRTIILAEERKENMLLEIEKENQLLRLQSQLAATEGLNRLSHDMKNHMQALERMSSTHQQKEYIGAIKAELDEYQLFPKTGNATLDSLIASKMHMIKTNAIDFYLNIDASPIADLAPIDIVTIFGNALDNAIEACTRLSKEQSRFISLKSWVYAKNLIINISNSSDGKIKKDDIGILSRKSEGKRHGVGLKSIDHTVSKLGGTLSYTMKNGEFSLKLMLPF